jgi:hypothetical protein
MNKVLEERQKPKPPSPLRRVDMSRTLAPHSKYVEVCRAGIVGGELESLPVCFCQCWMCGKWGTRSLFRVSLKDGTYVDMAQDCFDHLLQINQTFLEAERAKSGQVHS